MKAGGPLSAGPTDDQAAGRFFDDYQVGTETYRAPRAVLWPAPGCEHLDSLVEDRGIFLRARGQMGPFQQRQR